MHLGHDVRHPGQHIARTEHRARRLDRLRQPPAVPGGLADRVGDQRGGFGDIEPQAAGPAGPRQLGGAEEQQPVALRGGQSHVWNTSCLNDTLIMSFFSGKH